MNTVPYYDEKDFMDKVEALARLIEQEQIERLKQMNMDCQANIDNCKVYIKPGKKYIKVNLGHSGRFMVDMQGNIYGIKAYGQIHKGHWYGTLETIHEYRWGDYYPVKKPEKGWKAYV